MLYEVITKSQEELKQILLIARALKVLRDNNISTKVFDSGLAISLFRDNSTRTRFSFASACNLLGLEVQDLDEGKSRITSYNVCYTKLLRSICIGRVGTDC